jgi:hypothetical protein
VCLEIPCKLIFRGEAKLSVKVKKPLQKAVDPGPLSVSIASENKKSVEHPIDEPKHPHNGVGECDLGSKPWL